MRYVPDEVVNNVPGMDIDCYKGREGAAVQVGQYSPDHAGEAPQLGGACQQVLSQGSRRAGCAQALLHPSAPVHLHCLCLSTRSHWPKRFPLFDSCSSNCQQALFMQDEREKTVQFEAAPILLLWCCNSRTSLPVALPDNQHASSKYSYTSS